MTPDSRPEAGSEVAPDVLITERAAEADARVPPPAQAAGHGQAQSYEEASARVEEIIRRLDSGEASLGETLELVREGKALIELCAGELDAVAGALEELRLDELVARLEGQAE